MLAAECGKYLDLGRVEKLQVINPPGWKNAPNLSSLCARELLGDHRQDEKSVGFESRIVAQWVCGSGLEARFTG